MHRDLLGKHCKLSKSSVGSRIHPFFLNKAQVYCNVQQFWSVWFIYICLHCNNPSCGSTATHFTSSFPFTRLFSSLLIVYCCCSPVVQSSQTHGEMPAGMACMPSLLHVGLLRLGNDTNCSAGGVCAAGHRGDWWVKGLTSVLHQSIPCIENATIQQCETRINAM